MVAGVEFEPTTLFFAVMRQKRTFQEALNLVAGVGFEPTTFWL